MLTSRIMLGHPNRIDQAEISGGSWAASLPLANIQTRLLSKVARSADAQPSSTTFNLDFGRPERIQIIALVAHNASLQAKIRYEGSRDAGFTDLAYDETRDVWGGLLTATWDIETLEWESDNFWLGTFSREDIEGLTATSAHVMEESVAVRYWRITILDAANPDGFVQIGRVFTGPVQQSRIKHAWGASLGYDDPTAVTAALGGAEFFDVREPVRVFRFTLQHLRDDEGYGRFLEMTRKAGVHGEIFVVPKPGQWAIRSSSSFVQEWVVPAGVFSICAVAVSYGGARRASDDGGGDNPGSGGGGGGGGLQYINNLPVVPGEIITVQHSIAGAASGVTVTKGSMNIFRITNGEDGQDGSPGALTAAGGAPVPASSHSGVVGYTGGRGRRWNGAARGGGGDAARYTGPGGSGDSTGGVGSGTSLNGQGSNLNMCGAGTGGAQSTNNARSMGFRLIWGKGRAFPATNTGDV